MYDEIFCLCLMWVAQKASCLPIILLYLIFWVFPWEFGRTFFVTKPLESSHLFSTVISLNNLIAQFPDTLSCSGSWWDGILGILGTKQEYLLNGISIHHTMHSHIHIQGQFNIGRLGGRKPENQEETHTETQKSSGSNRGTLSCLAVMLNMILIFKIIYKLFLTHV